MDTYIIDFFTKPDFFKSPLGAILITVFLVWSLAWKGSSLWHASKHEDKFWFIALLVVNTLGILEIAYLLYFSKNKINTKQVQKNVKNFLNSLRNLSLKNPHDKTRS